MNKQNLKLIHKYIQQKGNEIQSILPPLPGHPVRQAQAHLYKEIKLRFGVPAAELGDGRFDEVMKLLQICVENAHDPHISQYLTWVVPEPPKATLDNFIDEDEHDDVC